MSEHKNKNLEESATHQLSNEDEYAEDRDLEEEGQLAVDVYQDRDNVIIKSTIAGVEPEDINVTFDNDMVTIRGQRRQDSGIRAADYFYQECYWGSFSRSIILPVEVDGDRIKATIRNGVLTIILPKIKNKKESSIKVKDEN